MQVAVNLDREEKSCYRSLCWLSVENKPAPLEVGRKSSSYRMDSLPPPTAIIHLRVKNRHLFPDFSLVPPSVEDHRMKIAQEFQSLLHQTKHNNNNAFENELSLPQTNMSPDENLPTQTMKNRNAHRQQRTSVASVSENQSRLHGNKTPPLHEQNEFIQDGVQQLQRYQQLAKQYQFKSKPAVRQFLMKSVALSSDALHQLSTNTQTK